MRRVKVGADVPVFALEYLRGKNCATDDPVAIDAGLRVVSTTLSSNFVRPAEANKAQSFVKDKGKLLRTIGLEPTHFHRRLKLLLLTRLLPRCEQNSNMVELGPRGTGTSYAYQELSPYTILLTGPTTVANLFYNLATGTIGLVGIWMPEQGGKDMISTDPLAPGSVYTASVDDQGKVGLYRRGRLLAGDRKA